MGEMRKTYKIFFGKREGERQLGRPMRRLKIIKNIKIK
jgi:hypothetical protein